ncbi:MAG: hypothetical protein ABW220_03905, partial [Burkholderiaceae bacterium]
RGTTTNIAIAAAWYRSQQTFFPLGGAGLHRSWRVWHGTSSLQAVGATAVPLAIQREQRSSGVQGLPDIGGRTSA